MPPPDLQRRSILRGAGYRFLVLGSQQAIHNPSDHKQFREMDDNEALELLGFISRLTRRLDAARGT